MRLRGVRVAVLTACLAFALPVSAHETSGKAAPLSALHDSARRAAAVVDGFHAALRRGDTRAAQSFLADDALVFEAGGVERGKAEYASHHLGADAAFSQAVPAVITRRAGEAVGGVAWVATEGRVTGTYKEKPIDRLTVETMVLRETAAGWRIVHIHWSSAAAKKD